MAYHRRFLYPPESDGFTLAALLKLRLVTTMEPRPSTNVCHIHQCVITIRRHGYTCNTTQYLYRVDSASELAFQE